ncbi:MAG: hypothetical protein ACRDA4_04430 [Filifactoraceae bacterium]
MGKYNFKSKKSIFIIIIIIYIITSPLHIKVIESNPVIDENGRVEIKYQDGMLAIKSDNIEGYDYANLMFGDKFELEYIHSDDYSDDKVKIKKTYYGPFVRFKDKSDIEKNHRDLLVKTVLVCDVYKVYFSNPLIQK